VDHLSIMLAVEGAVVLERVVRQHLAVEMALPQVTMVQPVQQTRVAGAVRLITAQTLLLLAVQA
jgi:hypothetical protein